MAPKKKTLSFGTGERGRFRFDDESKKLIPCEKPRKLNADAPAVFTDEIEPTVSHATAEGKVFTSKSAYRRHLKEHGFRETGGEHLKDAERAKGKSQEEIDKEIKEDIEKSYYDIKYDRVQFSEEEKAVHERERRNWRGKWKIKSPY